MDNFLFNLFQLLIAIAFAPVIIMFIQVILVGLNRFYNHYKECKPYTPRISIIIPAWNEADVIEHTIEALLASDYDRDKMRIYLVDDASTDNTPQIANLLLVKYAGSFVYLRRDVGGQGKAHTLNHGLKEILSTDWAEAILFVDSDIIFEPDAIHKMVRHLADPKVGCVTCYIKESTTPGSLINRFIAFEYIVAEAIVRRSQNVIGVMACVAGGAQMHSRENIVAIGGQIDDSTFAEDTHTTFLTQIHGHKALFEGNAVVRSEEPSTIAGLWRQRKRWSRGNFQLTSIFKKLWFHFRHASGLGGIFFGLVWFSIALLPFLMIIGTIGLLGALYIDPVKTWYLFVLVGGGTAFIYLFITIFGFGVDRKTMKRSWFPAIVFPGLISLCSIAVAFAPNFFNGLFVNLLGADAFYYWQKVFLLFISCWVSACMFFAWLLYRLDRAGVPRIITNPLLVLIGYGPLLCVITLSALYAEITKREGHWDKTEKIGAVSKEMPRFIGSYDFEKTLKQDYKVEAKLLWKELGLLALLIILFILRYYFEF